MALTPNNREIVAERVPWSDNIPAVIAYETSLVNGYNNIYQELFNRVFYVKNQLDAAAVETPKDTTFAVPFNQANYASSIQNSLVLPDGAPEVQAMYDGYFRDPALKFVGQTVDGHWAGQGTTNQLTIDASKNINGCTATYLGGGTWEITKTNGLGEIAFFGLSDTAHQANTVYTGSYTIVDGLIYSPGLGTGTYFQLHPNTYTVDQRSYTRTGQLTGTTNPSPTSGGTLFRMGTGVPINHKVIVRIQVEIKVFATPTISTVREDSILHYRKTIAEDSFIIIQLGEKATADINDSYLFNYPVTNVSNTGLSIRERNDQLYLTLPNVGTGFTEYLLTGMLASNTPAIGALLQGTDVHVSNGTYKQVITHTTDYTRFTGDLFIGTETLNRPNNLWNGVIEQYLSGPLTVNNFLFTDLSLQEDLLDLYLKSTIEIVAGKGFFNVPRLPVKHDDRGLIGGVANSVGALVLLQGTATASTNYIELTTSGKTQVAKADYPTLWEVVKNGELGSYSALYQENGDFILCPQAPSTPPSGFKWATAVANVNTTPTTRAESIVRQRQIDDIVSGGRDATDVTRNDTQGKALNWEQLGISDADFAGKNVEDAITYLASKTILGQSVERYISTGDSANFYAVFPESANCHVTIKRPSDNTARIYFEYKYFSQKRDGFRKFWNWAGAQTFGDSGYYELRTKDDCPYDVGDYWITESTTNPATKWVGTSWTKLEGRVLLGTSSGYVLGTQGGSSTVALTLANLVAHTHTFSGTTNTVGNHSHHGGNHRHTVTSHSHSQASHTHNLLLGTHQSSSAAGLRNSGGRGGIGGTASSGTVGTVIGNTDVLGRTILQSGGGDNTGSSSPTTDYQNPTTSTTGDHNHTLSGTTGSNGSGTAFSIMNPYRAVNIWRRIA